MWGGRGPGRKRETDTGRGDSEWPAARGYGRVGPASSREEMSAPESGKHSTGALAQMSAF